MKKGGASHSYGIAVAQLAGVPKDVTSRARTLLSEYEAGATDVRNKIQDSRKTTNTNDNKLRKTLSSLDLDSMTPLEALETLAMLQKNHGQD